MLIVYVFHPVKKAKDPIGKKELWCLKVTKDKKKDTCLKWNDPDSKKRIKKNTSKNGLILGPRTWLMGSN